MRCGGPLDDHHLCWSSLTCIAQSGASSRQGSHAIPAWIVRPHRHRALAFARDLNAHGDHHHGSYPGTLSSAGSAQPPSWTRTPSVPLPSHAIASLAHHVPRAL
ncbi:hypothetical protein A4X13_0g8594 [Tilletia indica]|uniref:Uncharacterized protein n=1 Tax=Tilletia indica TaxID=43049 RepID=A0A8T8SDZ5_9BASI|nr:hypothetical protein A4X13_0g8594 [Tilletia indica]